MNLASLLAATARVHAARPAVLDPEASYTWGELAVRIRRAGTALAARGVRPGERYALVMRNSFRMAELIWGGHWTGAVPVPVNWRLAAPEVAAIVADADCRAIVLDPEFVSLLDHPGLAAWRARAVVAGAGAGLPEYDRLLAAAAPAPLRAAREDDEAIVLYTGGTTGRSKGVRLSHRNLVANAFQVGLALGLRADDVTLNVAPMFHAAALCCHVTTLLGGTHVFLKAFTPKDMLAAIERYSVTYTVVVPAMLKAIADEPEAGRYDTRSLRVMFYGSSPMPVDWMRRSMALFPGTGFHQAYGLTETAPILTILSDAEHRRALETGALGPLASAGKPLVGVELRIVGDDGAEVPLGQAGEIVVRAPGVMLGYHDRPQETAEALVDGWFRTGDLGRMDDEGRLYVLDRKKDMVITGGENVYSIEVEAALARHPDVAEVAVVGVPDDRLGEALVAIVAPRPGAAPSPEALIAHCRGLIGGFKIPRHFEFVPELPRSAVGKVLKTQLRRTYAAVK